MSSFLDRLRTYLTAANAWLVALTAFITGLADEITELLPEAWQGQVAEYATIILTIIAIGTVIVRRSAVVIEEHRGLISLHNPAVKPKPIRNYVKFSNSGPSH